MAFTVEDGTGLATANSYLALAAADTYHDDRGNAGWAGTSADRQQALILATEYVDARFGRWFRGLKLTAAQRLQWPRTDAFDDAGNEYANDAVPGRLEDAIAEYALRALVLTQQFIPDPAIGFATRDSANSGLAQVSGGGTLLRSRDKVGPIEEERTYASPVEGGTGAIQLPAYPLADLMLRDLLRSTWRVERA